MHAKRSPLAQLQRDMLTAILTTTPSTSTQSPDPTAVVAEINGGTLSPSKRLHLYQHNVTSTLCNTLTSLYPVVCNIVGLAFFTEMARRYIDVKPSHSGDLHDYGATFADFISRYQPAEELPYLSDVAKLEWHWHVAFHAADVVPFDLARLQPLSDSQLDTLKFQCAPSMALIASPYPLLEIWLFNQPDDAAGTDIGTGDKQINWDIDEAYVVISRHGTQVEMRTLAAPATIFCAHYVLGQASQMPQIQRTRMMINLIYSKRLATLFCGNG
ncbi:MAG: DUF2063 domain-containing protein [Gammaproteobacteria bacterium]|nr:DUF2063 domain-containing protein [Gammaproteobacteria bacterium]